MPGGDSTAWASIREANVHVPLRGVAQLRWSVWLLLIVLPPPGSVHFGERRAALRGFGETRVWREPGQSLGAAPVPQQEAALGWLQWGEHGRVLRVPGDVPSSPHALPGSRRYFNSLKQPLLSLLLGICPVPVAHADPYKVIIAHPKSSHCLASRHWRTRGGELA